VTAFIARYEGQTAKSAELIALSADPDLVRDTARLLIADREPRYVKTVLCGSCAPEWLSPEREDVCTQLCGHCERPMVLRLKLSELGQTFCSDLCKQNYRDRLQEEKRAEELTKVCEVCGQEFIATRRDAKTCSPGCKQKAYRQRKREVKQDK
jgi:hypothetical protein